MLKTADLVGKYFLFKRDLYLNGKLDSSLDEIIYCDPSYVAKRVFPSSQGDENRTAIQYLLEEKLSFNDLYVGNPNLFFDIDFRDGFENTSENFIRRTKPTPGSINDYNRTIEENSKYGKPINLFIYDIEKL